MIYGHLEPGGRGRIDCKEARLAPKQTGRPAGDSGALTKAQVVPLLASSHIFN